MNKRKFSIFIIISLSCLIFAGCGKTEQILNSENKESSDKEEGPQREEGLQEEGVSGNKEEPKKLTRMSKKI